MIIDRILQIIDKEGISKRTFYKTVGMSNGSLDKKRDLGFSRVVKILQTYPDISPIWLMLGEGPMLMNDLPVPTQKIIGGDNNIIQVGSNNKAEQSNVTKTEDKSFQKLSAEVERLQAENKSLQELLKKTEELLKSKDYIISLLRKEK
ncbi:MAG: hypothetical protein ACRBFS_24290 [Aureispira sp.]